MDKCCRRLYSFDARALQGERTMSRYECMVAAVALWGGSLTCSAGAATVEEAMQNVSASLARVPHLSDSDLLSDERGQRYEAAKRFIVEKQCSSGKANPLILTSLPLRLNLRGSLQGSGRVGISAVDVIQGERHVPSGPSFDIPLRVSAVADVPKEYLKEMTAFIETKGLPDEVVNKLRKALPQDYERLAIRIERLMNSFDPEACAKQRRDWLRADRPRYPIFVPPTF